MIIDSYYRKDDLWDVFVTEANDPDLIDEILTLLDTMTPDKKYHDHWINEITHHYTFDDGSYIFFTMSRNRVSISLHRNSKRCDSWAILRLKFS